MKNTGVHNRDFKPKSVVNKTNKIKLSRLHLILLSVSIALPVIVFTTLSGKVEAVAPLTEPAAISDTSRITSALHLPKAHIDDTLKIDSGSIIDEQINTQRVTVKSGDTLTHIFRRVGLGAREVHQVTQLKKTKALTRLSPGQTFDIDTSSDNKLQKLVYNMDKTSKLIIQKHNDQYTVYNEDREFDSRVTYAKGTISTSLFDAAHKAGLSDNVTMDLAYIFGWDIDFALDIREGDQFVVMYEELFLDGEKVRDGNILAAEFINQGKSFKTVRYTDAKNNSNYFSETGASMRKAFLRSPVDFTRISSRYGKRYHPTLKRRKKHNGVDYAASRGTPIKAAGDGKIVWRARKGGYGKTVIIKHANRYSTLYAHMKSYNRKARKGSRVKQGQVIGYVGTTGRSTGPHLHYEFRVNGVHRNPLTVKLPDAESIKKEYKSDFLSKSRPLIAQLNLVKNTNIALNEFQ